MNWFESICRNMGLMIHNVVHPDRTTRQTLRCDQQEQKPSPTVTLRRTTIEEIEIPCNPDQPTDQSPS